MSATIVLDSIGSHLDSLKTTIGWSLLVSVVFGQGGLAAESHISALGMTIAMDHAFFVAVAFYTFVNLKVFILLGRLHHLLRLLSDGCLGDGLRKMALHPFVANPFGYFVHGAPWPNSAGPGLLVAVWWLANCSLLILCERFFKLYVGRYPPLAIRAALGLLFLGFLAVGLLSLREMFWIDRYVRSRLGVMDATLRAELDGKKRLLFVLTLGGIAVGGAGGLAVVVIL